MSKANYIGNQQMLGGKKDREENLFNFKMCLYEQNINHMYSYTQGIKPANDEMEDRAKQYEEEEGKHLRAKQQQQAEYETYVYRMNNPPDRPYNINN